MAQAESLGEQAVGLNEGWSDFFSAALLSQPGDDLSASYAPGAYATLHFRGEDFTDNYYFGIRRYPYSTDMTKNPLTFGDIDPNLFFLEPGVPQSPRSTLANNPNPRQRHSIGTVWSTILWEVRANMINKHGFAGNDMIMQLIVDAMKISPPDPNFVQARDSILLADLARHSGANQCDVLWPGFAKRGLGALAESPFNNEARQLVESFDTPTQLTAVFPTGEIKQTPPLVPLNFVVELTEQSCCDSIDQTSVTLHQSRNGGEFVSTPMTNTSGSLYESTIAGISSADFLDWYISANTPSGIVTYPQLGASDPRQVRVAAFHEERFFDDFWTVMPWSIDPDGTDTATAGIWQRANPANTISGENPFGSGTFAMVTEIGLGAPLNHDVSDGATTLQSPLFDCTGGDECIAEYTYFVSVGANIDDLRVEVSNDNGTTWHLVEIQRYTDWNQRSVILGDFVNSTDQMRLRFVAVDPDPPVFNSILEARVDDVRVTVAFRDDSDFDADGKFGASDLVFLLNNWGDPFGASDLVSLLNKWGQ